METTRAQFSDGGVGQAAGILALVDLARLTGRRGRGVAAWARRRIRRWLMTRDERELLELYEHVAATVGGAILGAKDDEAVKTALDRAIANKDIYSLGARLFRFATMARVRESLVGGQAPPGDLVEVLGAHPAEKIMNGLRFAGVAFSEVLRLLANASPEQQADLDRVISQQVEDPLALVYEPSVPVAVREAMLSTFRALPAMLAISHAVATSTKLDPWCALSLAETVESGQRAYLRILASAPGSEVPETVLPEHERFDVAALEREQQEAARRIEELALRAVESGLDVFPPDPE